MSVTVAQSPAPFEPPDGQVYHGAFPVSQTTTNFGAYWLDPLTFENLAGKPMAIVLWYANWNTNFQNSVGYVISQYLKPAGRVIEIGWLPSGVPLTNIISGAWDNYLRQWFADARDLGEPIFLRFANEMNGNWLDYDGWHNGGSVSTELGWLATEKYKAAWRRVHDIAQEMRACNVAFVWAPNYMSWPNPNANWPEFAWNDWRNYYPGDEYVDWVGVDVYDFEGQDPRGSIQPFYDEYAARKPIILAETAGHYNAAVNADKERYIGQLFDAMETHFPRIKAFVWFNYHEPAFNWRIDETPAARAAYQARVANSRYVGAITRTVPATTIARQPQSQAVAAGEAATFSVIAGCSSSPLHYQWRFNGTNLASAVSSVLTLTNVQLPQAGSYAVLVTNISGSVLSSNAFLTVLDPCITNQPRSQPVAVGRPAAFSVGAAGTAPLIYTWRKNGLPLTDGGNTSGSGTASLILASAQMEDAGTYSVVVTNAYGSVTSSPATLTVVTNIFGSVALAPIPTLAGDTANEARAITPDGRYVVGLSGARGFLYDLSTASLVNVVSSDGAPPSVLTGVGYRTQNGQRQLLLSGLSSNLSTAWMTANDGTNWGAAIKGASGKKPTVPAANGLAGTASDACYSIWTDEGTGATDNWGMRIGQFSGPWPMTPIWGAKDVPKPGTAQVNGVAGNGRAVGWRRSGTTLAYTNCVVDATGSTATVVWSFNGLDGTTAGQAFSVSADGMVIFGMSPKTGAPATNSYGYKALFNTNMPGPAAQLSVSPLPDVPDAAGATNLAIPFGCTADGQYAVGMSCHGVEKAVLWDTGNPNSAQWSVVDLSDVAAVNGVLDGFARLSRGYAVGTNAAGALVIAGVGLDTNNPAKTRGFVMTLAFSNPPVVVRPTVTVLGSYPAGFTFSFPTVASASVTYYLECTANLTGAATWSTITSTPGTGAIATLPDTNPSAERRFYRIRVQ